MASDREYLDYVMEQLSEAGEVSFRPMMGEYVICYRGRVIGGVYDDRFLVKAVKAARERMPDAPSEIPYEGAKAMLLVDNVENKAFLKALLEAMEPELPASKARK
jgi:TfoX/Sxy family transcriptional regulator of competence genes